MRRKIKKLVARASGQDLLDWDDVQKIWSVAMVTCRDLFVLCMLLIDRVLPVPLWKSYLLCSSDCR